MDIKNLGTKALFLDRDGVINMGAELGEYIMTITDFHRTPGIVELIKEITDLQIPIFIITNQQCIGRGLMTEDDLSILHDYMTSELAKQGGNIEKIMVCPHLRSLGCDCRKPKPGMLLSILHEFPHLNPFQCLFVGDSDTDIEAGIGAGVQTLLIKKDRIIDDYDKIISFFTFNQKSSQESSS